MSFSWRHTPGVTTTLSLFFLCFYFSFVGGTSHTRTPKQSLRSLCFPACASHTAKQHKHDPTCQSTKALHTYAECTENNRASTKRQVCTHTPQRRLCKPWDAHATHTYTASRTRAYTLLYACTHAHTHAVDNLPPSSTVALSSDILRANQTGSSQKPPLVVLHVCEQRSSKGQREH